MADGGGGGGVGGDGGGDGGGAGSATGSAPPGPLTASEIDNMSSVSTTSTVLTDLSSRMEKIEDLLSRLLEASTGTRGSGGGGSGNDVLLRWGRAGQKHGGGQDNDTGSSEGGSGTGRVAAAPELLPCSSVLNKESAGELMGAVKDTAEELRQVRGRLRQLELEEAMAKAARAGGGGGGGGGGGSSSAPPAPTTVAPRSPQPSIVDAATASRSGSTSGVAGDLLLLRGAPASELPACGSDSQDGEELLQASSAAQDEQARPSPSNNVVDAASAAPSRWPASSVHIGQEGPSKKAVAVPSSRLSAGDEEGEEKGVGMGDGGEKDEADDQMLDGGDALKGAGGGSPSSGGAGGGAAGQRAKSFGLSPISEAPL